MSLVDSPSILDGQLFSACLLPQTSGGQSATRDCTKTGRFPLVSGVPSSPPREGHHLSALQLGIGPQYGTDHPSFPFLFRPKFRMPHTLGCPEVRFQNKLDTSSIWFPLSPAGPGVLPRRSSSLLGIFFPQPTFFFMRLTSLSLCCFLAGMM